MASSNPSESHKPNGLVDASSSNSGKEEKSSLGKITKNPIECHTSENALNPEVLKKLKDLPGEDTGTNSQESELYHFLRFRSNTLTESTLSSLKPIWCRECVIGDNTSHQKSSTRKRRNGKGLEPYP